MATYGMVIDLTRCVGCRACMVACKIENGTPADIFFMYVFRFEEGNYPNSNIRFLPRPCMHCYNPPCVKACPFDARIVWKGGTVQTDYDNCKGARLCEKACPYGVNFFNVEEPFENLYIDWTKEELKDIGNIFGWWNPDTAKVSRWDEDPNKKERRLAGGGHVKNTVSKCTFCIHRIEAGKSKTACQEVCPVRAIYFGDLDDPNSEVSKVLEGKVERKKVKIEDKEVQVIVPREGSGVFTLRPDINSDPLSATYPKVFFLGDPPGEDAVPIDLVPVKPKTQLEGDEKYGNLDIPFGAPLMRKKELQKNGQASKNIKEHKFVRILKERMKMKVASKHGNQHKS